MLWKDFVKNYLYFSKKERLGALTLLLLITLAFFLPYFFAKSSRPLSIKEEDILRNARDTLAARHGLPPNQTNEEELAQHLPSETGHTRRFYPGTLFPFDPNTLSMEGWEKLGLNERTARTILHYRNKGGRFYKPEDLKKIWGLPVAFYESVKTYITITPLSKPLEATGFSKPVYQNSHKRLSVVQINEADTSAFIALPGIGSKLAARIVNFREKLGGFYTVDQIGETYGLPDTTFQKIKPYLQLKGDVKRIAINVATKEELKSHPYIRWKLANAIVEYRNQHGDFKRLEELKNIAIMDEDSFNKIVHYLSL